MKLRIVITIAMLVALCAPSAAFAAVRSGYDDDPRDVPVNIDPNAPPNLQPDIARVAASYDDAAGTVRLEYTYYDALPATGYEVGETLYISNPSDPVAPSASVTWFYDVDQTSQFALNQATMQVPGLAGQLRTTWQLSADRRTLTADFASPAIAQRNWTQVTNLYGGYDAWDSFYFAGYAPPPPAPLPTAPSYGPVPVPSVPSPVPSVQSPAPSASAAASDPIVLTSANAVAAFKGYLTRKYKTIFTKATDSYVRCANIFEDADSGDQLGDCYAEFGTGKSWRLVIASPQAKYDATSVTIAPNPFVRAWRRVFRKAGATCLRNQGDPIKGTLYSNSFGCDARMASEIYKGVTGWHGTGTGSFLPVTRYTCHKGGRTYTCANKMGDAFRWTPRRATAKRGAASTPKPRRKKKAHRSPAPSGCDPNYSGCLKPNVSDYDCAGGSGDGPYYTGPVRVKGNDHYDLDRDGDGLACETS